MKSDTMRTAFENEAEIEWFVSLCWNLGLFCCSILDYMQVETSFDDYSIGLLLLEICLSTIIFVTIDI